MVKIKIYLLAVLVTSVLLISAFSFNWYMSMEKQKELEEIYTNLQRAVTSSQLEFEYISEYSNNNCALFNEAIKITKTNLIDINQNLENYKEYLVSDAEFSRLKADQSILYVKTWMITVKMKERCNLDTSTILYFWDTSSESKQQGYILDAITEQRGDDVLVIPLDYNFDLGIIKLLEMDHNITSAPTILIDEKIKLEGLKNREDIEKYL